MKRTLVLPWLFAFAVPLSILLLTHEIVKLPSEPFVASPAMIYENYTFAIALGLSLPFPGFFGAVLLFLTGFISFRIFYFFLKKIAQIKTRNEHTSA